MRLEFSEDAAGAFNQIRLLHYMFAAAVPLLIFAGELVASSGENEWNGYLGADHDQLKWLSRLVVVLLLVSVCSVVFTVTESRILRRLMSLEPGRADLAILQALTTTQVTRSFQPAVIATYGLVLYLLLGDRLDLYLAGGVGLILVALFRPSRRHWEAVFQRASVDYPSVNPSPW